MFKLLPLGGFFIGHLSNHHWLPLSLTPWRFLKLTNYCLVDLTDVTLAFEDASSKIVEVVTVADVDAEKHVDNSWCRFDHIELNFCLDFVHKVWIRL